MGPSKQEGFFRLYFALDLSTYAEIPQSGLIFAESPEAADPAKATKILVNSTTKLEVIQSLEASFLNGFIAKTYASRDPDSQSNPGLATAGSPGPILHTSGLCGPCKVNPEDEVYPRITHTPMEGRLP